MRISRPIVSFYPLFITASVCLILGTNISADIIILKNNITDCIENTFPRPSLYFNNDKEEPYVPGLSIPKENITRSRQDLRKVVKFFLYTPELNGTFEILEFNNSHLLATSHFDPKRPTRFVTHGFLSSSRGQSCVLVREAYMKYTNCNVIVVDWSGLTIGFYTVAAFYVQHVGEYIGAMISFLEKKGMNPDTTTLVGHSLGAHVMGVASSKAAEKVKYIYGLDPAMPCFLNANPSRRISPDDAKFVQVIHTSLFGDRQPLGDYDFYPNEGIHQPKCAYDLITESICSHSMSYEYFAESLNKSNPPFYSILCKSLESFKSNKCENYETIMGGIDYVPKHKGRYYLYTKSYSPYSFGKSYQKKACSVPLFLMWFINIINYLFGTHFCYE